MDVLKNIVSENKLDKIRLLEPDHYVIGGQPVGEWDVPNDNNAHYDLACTAQFALDAIENLTNGLADHNSDSAAHKDIRDLIALLWTNIKLANPVGMLSNSVDTKVFNSMWLSLNGEYISRANYTPLYDYLLGLGYVPNAQQLIQLPDARGLVLRSQNKGRFPDVTEIAIGKYQADATQKVYGTFTDISVASQALNATGAFALSQVFNENMVDTGVSREHWRAYFNFDNSRVARIALEERVKSLGTHAQIFVGFPDKLEVTQ